MVGYQKTKKIEERNNKAIIHKEISISHTLSSTFVKSSWNYQRMLIWNGSKRSCHWCHMLLKDWYMCYTHVFMGNLKGQNKPSSQSPDPRIVMDVRQQLRRVLKRSSVHGAMFARGVSCANSQTCTIMAEHAWCIVSDTKQIFAFLLCSITAVKCTST